MRTLEQIGINLSRNGWRGCEDSIHGRGEGEEIKGEYRRLLAALRAADAELARGREAETLLRECVDANSELHAYLMQSSINGLTHIVVDRCNKAYEAMAEWLAGHPPREGEAR